MTDRYEQIGWWVPYDCPLVLDEEERFVSLATAVEEGGLREPYKSEVVPVYIKSGGGDMTEAARFVLDLDSNPHPNMLAGALAARRGVFEGEHGDQERHAIGFWLGYLAAMADATGCPPADLIAWMDHHERTTADG